MIRKITGRSATRLRASHRVQLNARLLWLSCALALPAHAATEVVFRIRYEYDDLGRVVAQHGNDGQVLRYAYDNENRITAVTDALNRRTSLGYDVHGRVIQLLDPAGVPSSFAYDANQQLVSVKDPRGKITVYERDGFGQVWRQVSPDTGVTHAEYNAAGMLTSATRNDGVVTTHAYDGLGRLIQINVGAAERNYNYDSCTNGKGRLCVAELRESGAIKNWAAQVYSPQGWLTQRWDGGVDEAGQSYDGVIAHAYDGMGRATGVSYPSGVSVGYGYNAGQLTTMTATIGGTTSTVASNIAYQPFGPANGWTYGSGLERSTHYDTDGRVFGIGVGTSSMLVQSLTYGFNAVDEIVAITNGMDAGQTRNYEYDALGRLVGEVMKGAEWSYDANGNRTRGVEAGVQTAHNLDPTSNRLLSYSNTSGTRSYGYDALGNRISETAPGLSASYAYDGFTRMRSATVNGVTSSYDVNALSQRIGKATSAGHTRFVYAGQNQLLAEHGSGGWTSYLWLGSQLVGFVRSDQQIRFVHSDHLGRPEVVTNSAKQVMWRAGNEAWDRTSKQDAIGGLSLGFPGQYHDAETGLWYNGYRYYDSSTGYMQPDPMGLSGGSFSTYTYASGDPIRRIDPLGLLDGFVGVELDMVGLLGFEVSVGLVHDYSNPLDSGAFVSYSGAAGANVGVGVIIGGALRDIEGQGASLDINAGTKSGSVLLDDKGFNGFAGSFGPGIGGSVAYGNTRTLSILDVLKSMGFRNPPVKRPAQVTVGDLVTTCVGEHCLPTPSTNDGSSSVGGGSGGEDPRSRDGDGGRGVRLGGRSGCYGDCDGSVDLGPVTKAPDQRR